MKDHIYQRVLEIAEFLVAAEATVRQAANAFGVSKSTVHKDLTERLPLLILNWPNRSATSLILTKRNGIFGEEKQPERNIWILAHEKEEREEKVE